jgi:hypothetical protein
MVIKGRVSNPPLKVTSQRVRPQLQLKYYSTGSRAWIMNLPPWNQYNGS